MYVYVKATLKATPAISQCWILNKMMIQCVFHSCLFLTTLPGKMVVQDIEMDAT